ncbi:MAG: 16S rRNA (guanine(966)-N(2))-methyltransferase RsmD [Bdellovibrio sp.]|nr:MAG: 16S rRNA (guanine(966)-N(2))-methyltransferase RsmD [Bdellovibrio sp.]
MRIIGGKYGGRHLVPFQASHLRPTSDRVKESLFNILAALRGGLGTEGSRVLDLFCGTGSLGIEALSRGARGVTFVDQNRKSLDILKRNLSQLNIPSEEQIEIHQRDAFKYLKTFHTRGVCGGADGTDLGSGGADGTDLGSGGAEGTDLGSAAHAGEAFDLILIDPPFTEELAHDVMTAVASSLVAHSTAVIAILSSRKERLGNRYPPLGQVDLREFGDKVLRLFKFESAEVPT